MRRLAHAIRAALVAGVLLAAGAANAFQIRETDHVTRQLAMRISAGIRVAEKHAGQFLRGQIGRGFDADKFLDDLHLGGRFNDD